MSLIDKLQSIFKAGRHAEVEHIEIRPHGLPDGLAGMTIGHLTDLHLGPSITPKFVQVAVERMMAERPDMVVLTGDFVSRKSDYAAGLGEALAGCEAPMGVWAVRGNHDFWVTDEQFILDELHKAGAQVLINESVELERQGSAFHLCGVDDTWDGNDDIEATLSGVPDDAFKLLLCHSPDFADTAAEHGIHLQLSGHTHGGQVRIRSRSLASPKHGRKYVSGWYQLVGSHTQVFVSRGVGAGWPPIRYGSPAEVSLITLQQPKPTSTPE